MLTVLGPTRLREQGFCDGISRRDFLTIGGMALGGIGLGDALWAEQGRSSSHKAIINIYLPGGPPHIDMWDPKPNAPAEIRGEFQTIQTNVPGISVSEMFPRMAQMMDKFVLIRSLADSANDHDAYQCMTGRHRGGRTPPGGWPQAGAWVSHALGPVNSAVPANVALMYPTGERRWGATGDGGFLGVAHTPFNVLGREARSTNPNMLLQGVTLDKLHDRTKLRQSLDRFRRDADQQGMMTKLDVYAEQALGILTTSKLVDALDLSQEDPKILARYGRSNTQFQRDGAPPMIENLCLARRLVEAGARFISMNYSRWDWHGPDGLNYPQCREECPLLDQGLSALVTDLHERCLDRDVSIVVWGEFGRTPKINGMNSRDHWPQANTAVLAGGGMRTGQTVGSTNKNGEKPQTRPVTFQEIFATLYKCAGIDTQNIRIFDQAGVPQYLVEPGNEPLPEVL